MKRLNWLVCTSLLVPALAFAQPKSADDWYKEGETQYNLGNFDAAAEAFKQGFAVEPVESKKAAYLFNVAQAYRQGNKCRDSAFFYKRYLALKDQDTAKPLSASKRAEIEGLVQAQEECARQAEANARKPPDSTMKPDGSGTETKTGTGTGTATGPGTGKQVGKAGGEGDDDEEEDDDDLGVRRGAEGAPTLVSARFVGGGALVGAGGLDIPLQATFTLIAGYPVFAQDKLVIDAGLGLAYTPVPYRNELTMGSATASLTHVLANAGASYRVAPKISVRGDLGLGVLAMGGIEQMGNPFTAQGAPTTGTLAMFALRVAASAEYELTPNLVATVMPLAFSVSPAKAGLREDIGSITRLDFMLGLGYRM
jgi:tetratricopeptide (TPR) repeat protein